MPPNAPHRRDFVENRIYYSVSGGDNEIRTRDLCVANASLYQLSHTPVCKPQNAVFCFIAPPAAAKKTAKVVEMVRVELTS